MIDVLKATAGALLHDIGKVVQRAGSVSGTHSEIGKSFLKGLGFTDKDILDCVEFHHAKDIRIAANGVSPYAYIAYIADNIAAANDRRNAPEEYSENGWDSKAPLQSVFNLLNGKSERHFYKPVTLDGKEGINFPLNSAMKFEEHFYSGIVELFKHHIKEYELSYDYIGSLIELTEAALSFVPSSTDKSEVADISLYDHIKLTAAVAGCIAEYLSSTPESDYQQLLFKNEKAFRDKKFAVIYSADISGIQDFIYTIHSSNALKSLRARSFYLEIFLENLIDEILDKCELTRANLLYSGGGHLYMLLPNTERIKARIREVISQTNNWLLERFRAALYVADGYCECSANDLQNEPAGTYEKVFTEVSRAISAKKIRRYSSADIQKLNNTHADGTECRICKAVGKWQAGNDCCDTCDTFIGMSGDILRQYDKGENEAVFFAVTDKQSEASVQVSETRFIKVYKTKRERLPEITKKLSDDLVRLYGKNDFYMGKDVSTRLWVADYCKEKEISKYAEQSEGINRIGVLRMDVDNLGSAFTTGFKFDNGKYNTLSRTATFSRHLSMFFKRYINTILYNSDMAVTVIYSGGDDVFLIGAWDDIIDSALEIRRSFQKYSQGKLTVSAGIGIYPDKYPIHVMARETGELEDFSKTAEGKNSVTLFTNDFRFKWDELSDKIIREKRGALEEFFGDNREKGNSFLYSILSFLNGIEAESNDKNKPAKISLARFAYLMARESPKPDDSDEIKKKYDCFSRKMYDWMTNTADRKRLKTAIYLYVYSKRGVKKND